MNFLQKTIYKINLYQQSHKYLSFAYAVIKKYGQDNGSYQSAIITYYSILSLFPLLIVFTNLTQIILKNNLALKNRIASSINHYFPIIGNQLTQNIRGERGSGIAVAVSLIIIFYGALGCASALQYAVNNVWKIPKINQPNYIKNITRNLGIVVGGGLGFILASTLSTYVTIILGHDIFIKILATLLSTLILWITFIWVFKLSTSGNKTFRQVFLSSAIAAIGLQIIQSLGGIILSHEIKGLKNGYGAFSLIIGLLFWIYLQAEVILYSVEIEVVRVYHLYPRSFNNRLTIKDKEAYEKNTKSTKQHVDENISVGFKKTKKSKKL